MTLKDRLIEVFSEIANDIKKLKIATRSLLVPITATNSFTVFENSQVLFTEPIDMDEHLLDLEGLLTEVI